MCCVLFSVWPLKYLAATIAVVSKGQDAALAKTRSFTSVMCLFCRNKKCKGYGINRFSIKILKESLQDLTLCARIRGAASSH